MLFTPLAQVGGAFWLKARSIKVELKHDEHRCCTNQRKAPSFLRTSDSNPLPTPPPTFLSCANMHALSKEYNIFTCYFKDIGTSFTWSCKAQRVHAHPCRWDTAPRVWSLSLLLNILNTQFWRFTTVSRCCDLEMWPWSLKVVWLGHVQ